METDSLRFELTPDPYSFVVREKATDTILLQHHQSILRFDATDHAVLRAEGVTTTTTNLTADLFLEGGGHSVMLDVSVHDTGRIRVVYTSGVSPAEAVEEVFVDQGERIYGIFENPYAGALDNRGLAREFLGGGHVAGGTYAFARAPFYLTSRGYGIYTESVNKGHYSLGVNGQTRFRFEGSALVYHILYGPSHARILEHYNAIAGPSYLPPAWAFGSIWWRDDHHQDLHHAVNAQENVINDANELRNHRIPATALWIDRPYTSGSWGWGNGDFDASFPDPVQMVADVNARGLQLMLWIANRCANRLKDEGTAYGYVFPNGSTPAADMRIPPAYAWFQDHLSYYPNIGIKGYKIDRGHEGEMPESVENENVPLFARMAMEGMQAVHPQDSLVFARNVNDRQRQYCGVWNGDTTATFAGLSLSVKHALRCGLMNFPLFGSDTGGYAQLPNKELFARWLGFSAYCTIMEVLNGPNRTIWYDYDAELIEIARQHAAAHHALIPYTRSCMFEATQTGLPVIRALLLAFPEEPHLESIWDQYLYGPSLLVAPILQAGVLSRPVQLPAGDWLDGNDGQTVYAGGQTVVVDAPWDQIPLFIRAGAIIPRGDILEANNNWTPDWSPWLDIECYPFEGRSETFDYYGGSSVETVRCRLEDGRVTVEFGNLGQTGSVLVACREYGAVERNHVLLSEGTDFAYDAARRMLRIPYTGATTVDVAQVAGLFVVEPDLTPPTILSVSANNATEVTVAFSEPVDLVSAIVQANYALDQGVTVSNVVLVRADTVRLITSPLTADATYVLTVENVQDVSGNPIPADSTAVFTYVSPVVISNLQVASADPTDVYPIVNQGLAVGALLYIDRVYTFTSVPADLQGATYIRTANDDKQQTINPFMTFEVDRDLRLLVGYDDRLALPAWMAEFSNTGQKLLTDEPSTTLSLYELAYPAGSIALGGNEGIPASSMYIVILVPRIPDPLQDDDADGLPDAWERLYFGNAAAGLPDTDPDGDGLLTWEEYVTGSDPTDREDCFKLEIKGTGNLVGEVELSVNVPVSGGPGYAGRKRYYTLEHAVALDPDTWQAVAGHEGVSAAGAVNYTPPAGVAGYYRTKIWLSGSD